MVRLAIQNEEFAQTDLTSDEINRLINQWNDLYIPGWSFERQFIGNKLETVKLFCAVAKNALNDLNFGGINCGNSELGFTSIRPGHVGLVNGTVPEADNVWKWKHDCRREANGVGFENWIHSPTTSTTPFAVSSDSCFYPMYIVEENVCPKIQTVKMSIGRTNILHYDVRAARLRDYQTGTNLIPLPTTFWIKNMDVLVALGFMASGVTEPRLGGFCVGKGSFLNSTFYTASINTVLPGTAASV